MKKELSISIILFLSIFIAGCNDQEEVCNDNFCPSASASYLEDAEGTPSYITDFYITSEEDIFKARFSLVDSNRKYVVSEGSAEFKIFDKAGIELYSKRFDVRKNGFGAYSSALTGEELIAYSWEIPKKDISKAFSPSGTAYLLFKSSGKGFEINVSIYNLPEYTDEELKETNEKSYDLAAFHLNRKLVKGDFEVVLTEAGSFSPVEKGGLEKEYYRVDLSVKSLADEAKSFTPTGMVIVDEEGKEYRQLSSGTLFNLSNIEPKRTKTGYALFESLPPKTNAKLKFSAGYNNIGAIDYEYNLPGFKEDSSTWYIKIIKYFWSLFSLWITTLFIAPFKTPSILWTIVPVWLGWIFAEFFQEKAGTSLGDAMANSVVVLWGVVECARQSYSLVVEGIITGWPNILLRIFIFIVLLVYGFIIIHLGWKGHENVKYIGRVREVSYVLMIFTPFFFNAVPFSASFIISAILFFPLYYYFMEFANHHLPDPKAILEERRLRHQQEHHPEQVKTQNPAPEIKDQKITPDNPNQTNKVDNTEKKNN